jgi:RNA recognition motif-containing protein
LTFNSNGFDSKSNGTSSKHNDVAQFKQPLGNGNQKSSPVFNNGHLNPSHQSQPESTNHESKMPTAKTSSKKAALLPIPSHHYEEAQRKIMLGKLLSHDVKMNPHNPEGLTALWVGNIQPDVRQEKIFEMFSQFGVIQSVKCMPDKFCAFVNFYDKECAGKAMRELQGVECSGQHLLIKFPNNPIVSLNSATEGKNATKIAQPAKVEQRDSSAKYQQLQTQQQKQQQQQQSANKVSGPVNGNECYFWRTTGCTYPKTCRYLHVPEHKGIDKKPWHK